MLLGVNGQTLIAEPHLAAPVSGAHMTVSYRAGDTKAIEEVITTVIAVTGRRRAVQPK
jgi:hypothetical protein